MTDGRGAWATAYYPSERWGEIRVTYVGNGTYLACHPQAFGCTKLFIPIDRPLLTRVLEWLEDLSRERPYPPFLPDSK